MSWLFRQASNPASTADSRGARLYDCELYARLRGLGFLRQSIDPATHDGTFRDHYARRCKVSLDTARGADIDFRARANVPDDRAVNRDGLGHDIGADVRIRSNGQALI